jgi:hypothetical protein
MCNRTFIRATMIRASGGWIVEESRVELRRLVELKIAMEFGVLPLGDTLPAAATNDEGLPRLLVSHFGNDHATFFRHDLSPSLRAELASLGPRTLMTDEAFVRAFLDRERPSDKVYRIRWYTIGRMPEPSEYPDVTVVDGRHVILVDGVEAAWARTDCEIDGAAEVSIETLPQFRRRGFARQVTASWAASVLGAGKVAYYSHLIDNTPSAAVAASLGLAHLSDEVEYT